MICSRWICVYVKWIIHSWQKDLRMNRTKSNWKICFLFVFFKRMIKRKNRTQSQSQCIPVVSSLVLLLLLFLFLLFPLVFFLLLSRFVSRFLDHQFSLIYQSKNSTLLCFFSSILYDLKKQKKNKKVNNNINFRDINRIRLFKLLFNQFTFYLSQC